MIRIVRGTGRAKTAKASFDAALAAANVHQYNLRTLSSVIPAAVPVEVVGTAPDLGPTGEAIDVVLARQTSPPGATAVAGLAWVRGEDGAGIFYEAEDHDAETVRRRLRAGIEHGCALRGLAERSMQTEITTADPEPETYTTAVVAAVYGESTALF
jgi:arginine decarboxylase